MSSSPRKTQAPTLQSRTSTNKTNTAISSRAQANMFGAPINGSNRILWRLAKVKRNLQALERSQTLPYARRAYKFMKPFAQCRLFVVCQRDILKPFDLGRDVKATSAQALNMQAAISRRLVPQDAQGGAVISITIHCGAAHAKFAPVKPGAVYHHQEGRKASNHQTVGYG
ncbi:uncharacterized protein MONBRDRAFT_26306 [Monosiga brevicollis MX1]|uniref:Uncharacterized protein n=1 Tax=Monosiga brevicollis TaxID=81824 RepID=A9V1Z9_MONBE|nr:uncharacterized protein MONBRDRAFT_26306 [Monosiga brevicollis MX1]EDQ88529.1 predicted protein [Monosiga brevicollis MX1]|eukprot:XP_001746633.1 hypothetical protein [Monosiga brevicollis MX1]